jgi:hypothetical protein
MRLYSIQYAVIEYGYRVCGYRVCGYRVCGYMHISIERTCHVLHFVVPEAHRIPHLRVCGCMCMCVFEYACLYVYVCERGEA